MTGCWFVFLFVLVCCLLFFGVYFVVPSFIGFDTYYYLNNICLGFDLNRDIVETLIFSALPCNYFVLKLVQALMLTITLYFILKTIKLNYKIDEKIVTLALIGLAPICFYFFFKLENDIFAFPLLAIAFYLFNLAKQKNFYKNTALSLVYLYSAYTVYEFTGYFLLIGATTNPIYLVIAIFSIPTWIGMINFNFQIAEQLPLIGLTTIGFFWCFIKWHSKKETIATILLTALQGQFAIFALFTFAQNIGKTTEWLETKFQTKTVLIPIVIVSVFGLILISTLPLVYYPNQEDLDLIKETVNEHRFELIINDFELGYIMHGLDYNTPYFSSTPTGDPFKETTIPFIAITKTDLNCSQLKHTKHYKVYKCNQ